MLATFFNVLSRVNTTVKHEITKHLYTVITQPLILVKREHAFKMVHDQS